MNPFIKATHLRSKLPGYGIAKSHTLNDSTLQTIATNYRAKFLKTFRFLQGSVIKDIPVGEALCSTKQDGISAFFYWERGKGHVFFHIPSCGLEEGLPLAQEMADALEKTAHKNVLIMGELFLNGGRRSRSYDVIRAIYSPKDKEALAQLHFAYIDVLVLDHQDQMDKTYDARVQILKQLPQGKLAYAADFAPCKGLEEINRYYSQRVQDGQEGIVFYDCTHRVVYKAKPVFSIDLAVVGYVEGTEEMTGKVVSVMGGLHRPDGSLQLVVRVGITSPELGEKLMRQLAPQRVKCDYLESDSDNRPIEWVKPTLVVEVNAEEALWEDTDGTPWTTTVLGWEHNKLRYLGQAPCIKPIHAFFERMREDKPVSETTFAQLPKFTNVPEIVVVPQASEPEILARKVYTKTAKGQVCVKKAVLWKQGREGCPGFVLHLLDYSPNRATSLEEKTVVSDQDTEIQAELKQWETEEITKGWLPALPQQAA